MKFVFALFVVVAMLATSAVSGASLPGASPPNLFAVASAAGVTPPNAVGKVVTEGARAVDEWFPDDGFSTTRAIATGTFSFLQVITETVPDTYW